MTEEQFNKISDYYHRIEIARAELQNARAMSISIRGIRKLYIRNMHDLEFECRVPEELYGTMCKMLIDYYTEEEAKARKEFETL